jgi:hypothetical protein
MNTREEISQWERENMNNILGWRVERDIKPNMEIISFDYDNHNGKKDKKVFEIEFYNKKCDICANSFSGPSYSVYDENFVIQEGLKQCEKCYSNNII